MTIWRMRIACWIPKATNTHSQCVTLIDFPLQQWLHERAPMLRYTYIVCLESGTFSFHKVVPHASRNKVRLVTHSSRSACCSPHFCTMIKKWDVITASRLRVG